MKVEVCENHHLETRPPCLVIDPDDKNTQNCPQTNKYPPKVLINKHWTKIDFQKRNHHQRFFLFSWLRLAPIWKSKTPINWIGAEKFPIPDHFQNLLLLVSHLEISINSVISILNKVLWHPWDLWGSILKNIISVMHNRKQVYMDKLIIFLLCSLEILSWWTKHKQICFHRKKLRILGWSSISWKTQSLLFLVQK